MHTSRLARFHGGAIENQFRQLFTERGEELKRKGPPTFRDPNLRNIQHGGLFAMPVILAKNSADCEQPREAWVLGRASLCSDLTSSRRPRAGVAEVGEQSDRHVAIGSSLTG